MGSDDDIFFRRRRERPVNLGHDVWSGHFAMVMPDVTVGTGSMVPRESWLPGMFRTMPLFPEFRPGSP